MYVTGAALGINSSRSTSKVRILYKAAVVHLIYIRATRREHNKSCKPSLLKLKRCRDRAQLLREAHTTEHDPTLFCIFLELIETDMRATTVHLLVRTTTVILHSSISNGDTLSLPLSFRSWW